MARVSMSRVARGVRSLLALAGVMTLVGACGTGGSTPSGQQFLFLAVGPGGGVVEAGPVRVTIPPGALAQDTGVAILPQATPLPIVGPDACIYSYVGPIHCCGPVGQNLLVPGTLRHTYDEALIPPGFTELDLVLLEWDNFAGVMRPRPKPPVQQDLVGNFFLDPQYTQLGHVAVGLRDCRRAFPFNLLVQNGGAGGQGVKPAPAGPGGTQGGGPSVTLWAADLGAGIPADGSSPSTTQVPTGGLPFDGFVPSPNQDRVAFASYDPPSGINTVRTVRVDGSGTPATIVADDPPNNVFLQAYDPNYGWLREGAGQHAYYVQYVSTLQPSGTQGEPSQRYEYWRRIGDATAAATRQHLIDASNASPDDIRQSTSGGLLSVYAFNFNPSGNFVDVVNVPAGTAASLALVPPSDGPQPPRFLPGANDLYMVTTNGQQVNRHQPGGGFVATLFELFVATAQAADNIVDFALAPDGNAFAAVVSIESKGTEYYLWMGTLADGVQATNFLGFDLSLNEMIWHPMQTGVFLDFSGEVVTLYTLTDDDGFSISGTPLFTYGMNNVDVNRLDGRIATLYLEPILIDQRAAQLPPGIYIWPPDASSFSRITPLNVPDPRSVRWLATWRNAAGRFSSRVR